MTQVVGDDLGIDDIVEFGQRGASTAAMAMEVMARRESVARRRTELAEMRKRYSVREDGLLVGVSDGQREIVFEVEDDYPRTQSTFRVVSGSDATLAKASVLHSGLPNSGRSEWPMPHSAISAVNKPP